MELNILNFARGNFSLLIHYSEYRIELDAPILASSQFAIVKQTDPRVQNNAALQSYFNEINITSANLLIKEGLEKNESFMVSAAPSKRIIRQQKLKALMFFIGFIFFVSISVHSTCPIVKKVLRSGHFRMRMFLGSLY